MTFRPRIRTIKPEMWADEKIGRLSRDARLLFVGLITMADDEGRLRGMPAAILGHVFPYDADALRKLDGWIGELADSALIDVYEHGGVTYVYLPGFVRHQVINRAKPSTLPVSPRAAERIKTGAVTDGSVTQTGTDRDAVVPSRAHGGSGSGTGTEENPPNPPEQAQGGKREKVEAAPLATANPRALGTNPRALGKRAAQARAATKATEAAGALTDARDEDRAAWDRFRLSLQESVGDSHVWPMYAERLELAGVDGDTLVIDGPSQSWSWAQERLRSVLPKLSDLTGVNARLASSAEHDGLQGAAA